MKLYRTKQKPTTAQHLAFQTMFDYFNEELFGSSLPQVLLSFSRRPRASGHFAPERWESGKDERVHEICLNPTTLHKPMEAAQTIVHEMVHLWQREFGEVPRKSYHDRQFAAKMKEVGLTPSSTGASGGKETGQHMSDYPTPGGLFLEVLEEMPKACLLPWRGRRELDGDGGKKKPKAPSSKTKFTCPACESNAWGRPDLNITCGDCDETMEASS